MLRVINKFIKSFDDLPVEVKGLIYLLTACFVLLAFGKPVEIFTPLLVYSIPQKNKGTTN